MAVRRVLRMIPVCRLAVCLNRLRLRSPILVASGTFGYAREMADLVDFRQLGGVIPKTVTPLPRMGNRPPRTIETAAGMLNSIGLDNDGLDAFIEFQLPELLQLPTAVIVNIAGKNEDEFVAMARRLDAFDAIAALELNISCPNVSGGVDYGTDPARTERVVAGVREATELPVIAKLTPNVTNVTEIAAAAAQGGADAVSLINTLLGLSVDWRARRPTLGNGYGGLSGPAIKPVALRMVHQVAQTARVPVIGVGGIQTLDDVLEFLVAGATAVQIGTANFYDPALSGRLSEDLERMLDELQIARIADLVGTLGPSQGEMHGHMEAGGHGAPPVVE